MKYNSVETKHKYQFGMSFISYLNWSHLRVQPAELAAIENREVFWWAPNVAAPRPVRKESRFENGWKGKKTLILETGIKYTQHSVYSSLLLPATINGA